MRITPRILLLSLLLGLIVAACSGGGEATSSPSATDTAQTTPAASAPASVAATSDPSPSSASAVVNANSASVDELQAAFEAAGISNADRWAREVAEYRPYPDDPTWAQLREELSKYNIAPDVLDRIISLLEV